MNSRNFLIPPPPPLNRKKNTPKKGELFSFFEIFTAEFSHFLVIKKSFFCHQKVTKLCSENFEKWKKFSLFGEYFFSVWGYKKKNSNWWLQKFIQKNLYFNILSLCPISWCCWRYGICYWPWWSCCVYVETICKNNFSCFFFFLQFHTSSSLLSKFVYI